MTPAMTIAVFLGLTRMLRNAILMESEYTPPLCFDSMVFNEVVGATGRIDSAGLRRISR